MEQMMERLLANMDANQKRLETKIKANHEDMADLKTQIGCLASRIDVNQDKEEACQREM
jgi:chromosome segregation ATPase